MDWLAKARADNKAIVYIGFGSITVPNPSAMTRSIIKAVLKSEFKNAVFGAMKLTALQVTSGLLYPRAGLHE